MLSSPFLRAGLRTLLVLSVCISLTGIMVSVWASRRQAGLLTHRADLFAKPNQGQITPAATPTPTPAPTPQPRIAFLSTKGLGGFEWGLYAMNVDGTQEKKLTHHDFGDRTVYFAWSPRGTKIAFEQQDFFGNHVNVINSDGTGLKTVSNEIRTASLPSWSPDGSRIVFGSEEGIYVVNVDGSELQRVTSSPWDRAPAWSPNGLQIAYWRFVNDEPRVFLVKPDGTAQTNIVGGTRPVWSPDGSKLLFIVEYGSEFRTDIFVMNKDGTNQINLTHSQTRTSNPRWSPDGRMIVFEKDVHLSKIFMMSSDGSVQTQITNNSGQNSRPDWSPDGKKIAFSGDREVIGRFTGIYSINSDGSGEVRLINGFDDLEMPKWQPAPTADRSPINLSEFFVRQHYLDFLSREPDQAGQDFWNNQITVCGSDAPCAEVKRINVSASFFSSIEFQQTGYLVERVHKVAFGNATGDSTLSGAHQLTVPVIRFDEFVQGARRIGQGVAVLQPGWEQLLESNKQAYALEFVQTSRFITVFPPSLTPTQFVDKLNQNAGNVLSGSERTTAINLFGGATDSSNTNARAQAVRQVAEDIDLFNAEYNRAFVLAEYFGYLRRNPNDSPDSDYTGYDFWLTKLNQFNGNYINAEMVKAFLSSIEYRQRFGP